MRNAIAKCLTVGFFLMAWVQPGAAQLSTTFETELTLELCPEYRHGGVAIDILYTVGADPTMHAAEVLDQEIDIEENSGTFLLRFPATYGVLAFNVEAVCRSTRGTSDISNVLSVSNCDNLALYDTDQDGIINSLEDTNCDNFFSPGDISNPDNVDTDGDGVRDLVETLQGFDPTNPGSSPRPFIYSGGVFDADGDGNANPYVWRGTSGQWFVRDFATPGNHLAFPFGANGDIPFGYVPAGQASNVGVIRTIGTQYVWLFRGSGFMRQNGSSTRELPFGLFGDNIVLGPWENVGVTNPAVARLFNNQWSFFIYQSDGSIRAQNWGGNGDIPKVQDYDGDGIFDIAVFRPSTQQTFVIRSSDNGVDIYKFGTGTADHTVRGDYTGDGVDDISFWEPVSGLFTVMTSDNGFDETRAARKNSQFYRELQLGLFNVHLPLNWNYQNGKLLFTVIDHGTGLRFFRPDNQSNQPPQAFQWGLPGDHQG
ncbi:MAG: VCBS repeat-containing protein [Bdellovibrionales bacterium]|nr:VCBS repeat-containing protein [Bdellovibrionales bacterium]